MLRNHPVLGHARFPLERIRPELRQYFAERNFGWRPFDRDIRSIVYERAKDTAAEEPFGTERDVYQAGWEYLVPSMAPRPALEHPTRVRIGGPVTGIRVTGPADHDDSVRWTFVGLAHSDHDVVEFLHRAGPAFGEDAVDDPIRCGWSGKGAGRTSTSLPYLEKRTTSPSVHAL